ncbi:hypothetical protein NQ176_g3766 [Zarea fungicola]|uniref:Uncharacterized protein n=1 Tax=Zarea fungicola TaxID=93591 RepID=A0ACC1NJC7_9HYPO|nr:hypothetical protein NQ176_g3766 [Lecanicillium fungicola]
MHFTGGCACEAIRFEANADDAPLAVCHCIPCQVSKRTASAYSLNLLVPRSAFRFTKGEEKLKTYSRVGDSGKAYHHRFCGECGVAVLGVPDANPDMCVIKAGVLDNPQTEFAKIDMELYTTRRRTYLDSMPGSTQYEHMLP